MTSKYSNMSNPESKTVVSLEAIGIVLLEKQHQYLSEGI